jgi:uncharacterized membrane protein YdjX (TVP38/TMEM64 family)
MNFLAKISALTTRPFVEEQLTRPEGFGWKEALALLTSLVITVVIVLFRDRLQGLEELGYLGAFLVMLLTSATLIMPIGGLAIVFVLGGALPHPWVLAIVAGLGASLGEFTGYLVGYSGHNVLARTKMYKHIHGKVMDHATWTIFFLAVIPTPLFDLAGIAAGALRLPWWRFFVPTLAGKTIKMIVVALAGAYSVSWIQQAIH